jgi:hypothetical protein
MPGAKNWCFTLNNYTEDEENVIHSMYITGTITYLVVGREVGESGTEHLQGYIQFKKRLTLSQVKQQFGINRIHLEISRGTPQQAAHYCKKDGEFEEFGHMESMGNWGLNFFLAVFD